VWNVVKHHTDAMAALGALASWPTPTYDSNVIPLHG
jgi:hypothetical protein